MASVVSFQAFPFSSLNTCSVFNSNTRTFYILLDTFGYYYYFFFCIFTRSLGIVPVAFSMTVSFMSAVTLMGIPTEIFFFGTMYMWYVQLL